MGYIERETGTKPNYLGLGLSSRRNLCIHPRVRDARRALFFQYPHQHLCLKSTFRQDKRITQCFPSSLCHFSPCQISQERNGQHVDAECRKLTASFVRAKNEDQSYCSFFNVGPFR